MKLSESIGLSCPHQHPTSSARVQKGTERRIDMMPYIESVSWYHCPMSIVVVGLSRDVLECVRNQMYCIPILFVSRGSISMFPDLSNIFGTYMFGYTFKLR